MLSSTDKHFRLLARVSSANVEAIRPILDKMLTKGSVTAEGDDLIIEADMRGSSAKDLNRQLLSSLRREEKRTRLRAEWTSNDGTVERYFDYVLKKRTQSTPSASGTSSPN